jgi:hypothetical protein
MSDWSPRSPVVPRDASGKLFEAFRVFHRANGHVWYLFERFAMEVVARGFRHYSADAVMHRVRWETTMSTRSVDGLKINNNHVAWYARVFRETWPEYGDLFQMRSSPER